MEREDLDLRRGRKAAVWGLFLMLLGSAFLLDRFHVIDVPRLGKLWPLVFLVIAGLHVVEGRIGGAITWILLGAWFLACEFEWYGLDFRNSWPLVLVAVGAGMVVRALRGEPGHRAWRGGRS